MESCNNLACVSHCAGDVVPPPLARACAKGRKGWEERKRRGEERKGQLPLPSPCRHRRRDIGVSPPRCRRRAAASDRGGVAARCETPPREMPLPLPSPLLRSTVPVTKSKKKAQTTRRRDLNPRRPYLNYCRPDTTARQKPTLYKQNCCI
mgnify:CR=1 FL=1